jgi:imidazole glycerol-phosphate synthase subunit HisF
MFRPRIIPVLLLRNKGLVKSIKFKNHRYIGDPINAVKIFNDLKADELVFLDILASRENRTISLDFVKNVGEEANMPFAVGGGIKSLEDIRLILNAGAEKVVINTAANANSDFIRIAADVFGSSTIVVCMDVKYRRFFRQRVYTYEGTIATSSSPVEYAKRLEVSGAGEIIVQSIDRDGTMAGYDIDLVRSISEAVTIPVIALGGAGDLLHMKLVHEDGYANGLAAGSMFVYHGSRKGILINYPSREELEQLFNENSY